METILIPGQYYYYEDMEKHIELKYNVSLRDFENKWFGVENANKLNWDHEEQWKKDNFPKYKQFRENPESFPIDFLFNTIEGNKLVTAMFRAYNDDENGKCKEYPNYDFWNYLCGRIEIHNGILRTVNWQELKDKVDEDWLKEILGYFVTEFGDTDYDIRFCW